MNKHIMGLVEWSIHINNGYWKPRKFDLLIIEFLQYALQGKCSRIMMSVPPRHGKSTLISRNFTSYFLSHFPEEQVILTSNTQYLASEFGREIKDIITAYGDLAPIPVKLSGDSKAKNKFHIDNHRGQMIATGSGGTILGFGAGLFVIDDPIKDVEDARSITIQRRLQRWFHGTAMSRLEKRSNGLPPIMVVIAQRLHIGDLQGIIKRNNNNIINGKEALQKLRNGEHIPENTWININLEAICTHPEEDLLGRKEGEALWPQQINTEQLLERKQEIGTYLFNCMYQGVPRIPEGNMFKRYMFYNDDDQPLYWKHPNDIPAELPLARYFDTAASGPTGDETAGFAGCYDGTNLYFTDIHVGHYWPQELSNAIITTLLADHYRAYSEKHQTDTTGHTYRFSSYTSRIEQEGGSQTKALISDIAREPDILENNIEVRADKLMRANSNKKEGKADRARTLASMAALGHIYFSTEIPRKLVEDSIEQLIDFTGEDGKADDRVDAMSGLARYFKREERTQTL